MVKYDNLYGNQREKLHRLYEEINPAPAQPEDEQLPKVAPSQIVRGHGEARIYAELPTDGNSFRRSSEEVSARIVFTDGKENHKVTVSVDELDILIAELMRIKTSLVVTNSVLKANTEAQKNWRDADTKYDEERRKFFTKKMANGKVTEAMIDNAESFRDLKFE